MKTKLLTIVLALGFLTILSGAFLLTSMGQDPVGAAIKFDPKTIDWDSSGPTYWYAEIRCGDGYDWNPRDIDDTVPILFEGSLPASDGSYIPGAYVAKFDGSTVFNIISGIIGHMQVPPDTNKVKLDFKVSGSLKDGTPFEGFGKITVRFVAGSNPEPPPPPP